MKYKNILITGGCGFIGSNLVISLVKKYPNYNFINFDKLTYAGNLSNLLSISRSKNYEFIKGDLYNYNDISKVFSSFQIDAIIHLAAESHVDRSIRDPLSFVKTNVIGTLNILEASKKSWNDSFKNKLFYHISTDEVYGSLGESGYFTENTSYDPHSPYSASKASSDHFVRAYGDTYNLPYIISNCSNNYGPYQFPEKLIPLTINNIIEDREIPVYGNGENIRDWLFVEDHVSAIDKILHNGKLNNTYNVGGLNEWKNIDLIKLIIKITDKHINKKRSSEILIKFIKDRPGHDLRYAIDSSKLKQELNWMPRFSLEKGLELTILWYLKNKDWLNEINSGAYKEYYKSIYQNK